jgi:hypothetical protein
VTAKRNRDAAAPWRPPTRRAFVVMLGAAAATLAAGRARALAESPREAATPAKKITRWIGHC